MVLVVVALLTPKMGKNCIVAVVVVVANSQNDHDLGILKSAQDLNNDRICQEFFNFWCGNRALVHGVKE